MIHKWQVSVHSYSSLLLIELSCLILFFQATDNSEIIGSLEVIAQFTDCLCRHLYKRLMEN